jgi:hypothetical protein
MKSRLAAASRNKLSLKAAAPEALPFKHPPRLRHFLFHGARFLSIGGSRGNDKVDEQRNRHGHAEDKTEYHG